MTERQFGELTTLPHGPVPAPSLPRSGARLVPQPSKHDARHQASGPMKTSQRSVVRALAIRSGGPRQRKGSKTCSERMAVGGISRCACRVTHAYDTRRVGDRDLEFVLRAGLDGQSSRGWCPSSGWRRVGRCWRASVMIRNVASSTSGRSLPRPRCRQAHAAGRPSNRTRPRVGGRGENKRRFWPRPTGHACEYPNTPVPGQLMTVTSVGSSRTFSPARAAPAVDTGSEEAAAEVQLRHLARLSLRGAEG